MADPPLPDGDGQAGVQILPLPQFTWRCPRQHLGTLKGAWDAIRDGVAQRIGLVLPEPVWVESTECVVYCRQVRLGTVQLGQHSVENLTDVLVRRAADLLSLADTARILHHLELRAPIYKGELDRLGIAPSFVHSVLRLLLKERVSIQDLEMILSTLIEAWKTGSRPEDVLERVREPLVDLLCQTYGGEAKELNVLTLAPKVEKFLKTSLSETSEGHSLALEPDLGSRFLDHLDHELSSFAEWEGLVLVCSPPIRLPLWKLTARVFPDLPILSWNEIAIDYNVNSVAMIEFKF